MVSLYLVFMASICFSQKFAKGERLLDICVLTSLLLKQIFMYDCARDFRMSHHCLVVNRQSLNSLLLFGGREKVSKNPYEVKVRGLVSNRKGVKHPKRLRYSEGASCLNYLVLTTCLFIGKTLHKV